MEEMHAVLVHGSFSSNRAWDPILEGLRAEGVTPHAVCLPGHGERAAESGPHIDLHAHAAAITEHVVGHGLGPIMLVGHSYGGMPVTQAWDGMRNRVAAVVYVDAGIPIDGQCQLDLLDPEIAAMTRSIASDHGGMLPAPHREWPTWPLAISALDTPLRLQGPLPAGVPRTLILATGNPGYHHAQAEERRGQADWTVIEVDCGHDVIGERSAFLVDALATIARRHL